jgi:hypothetical protein
MRYRSSGTNFLFRPGRPGIGTLLVAIWAGFMIATAGAAIYPPVTAIVTPFVCSGQAQTDSQTFSIRPGETIVTREFNCIGENGKPESAMFRTLAATFAVYAAIAFVLLTLLGLWRGRKGAASGPVPAPASGSVSFDATMFSDTPVRTVELSESRFHLSPNAAGEGGIEARLELLNGLRKAGLIGDADYETKKAEILSRL